MLYEVGGYRLHHVFVSYLNRNFNWQIREADFTFYNSKMSLLLVLFTFDKGKVERYLKGNSIN